MLSSQVQKRKNLIIRLQQKVDSNYTNSYGRSSNKQRKETTIINISCNTFMLKPIFPSHRANPARLQERQTNFKVDMKLIIALLQHNPPQNNSFQTLATNTTAYEQININDSI
jgi:hypothetical protein